MRWSRAAPTTSATPFRKRTGPFRHIGGTTGDLLSRLNEVLLREPSPLTAGQRGSGAAGQRGSGAAGQRETIAAYVSRGNECTFCAETHGAVARRLAGDAEPDALLTALLAIAEKVRVDGRTVTADDVARAREAGADDQAIHDTVRVPEIDIEWEDRTVWRFPAKLPVTW